MSTMMIEGTAECEHCSKMVDWYYQIPQKISSGRFDVEVIPNDRVGLIKKPYRISGDSQPPYRYILECYCKWCNHFMSFDYDSDIELH